MFHFRIQVDIEADFHVRIQIHIESEVQFRNQIDSDAELHSSVYSTHYLFLGKLPRKREISRLRLGNI